MKKVVIAITVAVVLVSVLIAPALADQGGVPNENAAFGQAVKDAAPMGDHASRGHTGWKDAPKMWGSGGIRANHP
ncbi:MAG: hypothetical protein JSW38_13435 [Dehalococcoidia bacterium]|jgi:hypothetical protein|nr:MAG: hypothetical protein JSV02_08420 [Dehalococcoidia bacterium]UCG83146.1 MAG: hypothetical protein JSW38_13435 [Dehalococcoidia bacterium]